MNETLKKKKAKRKAATQEPAAKQAAPANRIFTEQAYQKARATLMRKLDELNAGLDPEQ